MIRRFIYVAGFCAVLALPTAAQDTRALAESYVNLPGVQQMMDDMFAPDAMLTQLSASLPPGAALSDEQKTRIAAVMSEQLGVIRPSMEAAMIDAATTTFTIEELEALIAFYE